MPKASVIPTRRYNDINKPGDKTFPKWWGERGYRCCDGGDAVTNSYGRARQAVL